MHPLLGDKLDSQEIDLAIMQVLEQIVQVQGKGRTMAAHSMFAKNELLHTPVFRAMFDENILWKSKYYENFGLEQGLYVEIVEDWLK